MVAVTVTILRRAWCRRRAPAQQQHDRPAAAASRSAVAAAGSCSPAEDMQQILSERGKAVRLTPGSPRSQQKLPDAKNDPRQIWCSRLQYGRCSLRTPCAACVYHRGGANWQKGDLGIGDLAFCRSRTSERAARRIWLHDQPARHDRQQQYSQQQQPAAAERRGRQQQQPVQQQQEVTDEIALENELALGPDA